MENVPRINSYEKMNYWNQLPSNTIRKKIQKKSFKRRSMDRFFKLTTLAHDTHQALIEIDSPLRLCLYGDEDDLSMDVIVMNKNKKVTRSFTRPINNDNLKTLVKSIHNQIGLVLDYSV